MEVKERVRDEKTQGKTRTAKRLAFPQHLREREREVADEQTRYKMREDKQM